MSISFLLTTIQLIHQLLMAIGCHYIAKKDIKLLSIQGWGIYMKKNYSLSREQVTAFKQA